MKIILNGAETETADNETAAELVARLKLGGPVAVMINDDIIHRDKLSETILREGDRVELLRMMGGG